MEADRDRAAAPGCRSCGASLRWAKIPGPEVKRWFAICSCGLPAAYFPHRLDHEPDDPVSAALGPIQPSCRPPWIRVFQLTSGYPWWLPWRHLDRGCPGCQQRVTFAVWTMPRPERRTYSTLCLACGRATSEYVSTLEPAMSEAPLAGTEWSPPCVAVARLRRAVFLHAWPE